MDKVLVVGMQGAVTDSDIITIHYCTKDEAMTKLAQDVPKLCVMAEEMAADMLELTDCMQAQIEKIIVVEHVTPVIERKWIQYGADAVWELSNWEMQLLQRYPSIQAQNDNNPPKHDKAKLKWMRLPRLSAAALEEEEDYLLSHQGRKKEAVYKRSLVLSTAGIKGCSGATYSAIKLALHAAGMGRTVACVEVIEEEETLVYTSLIQGLVEDAHYPGGYHLQGVDYYPNQSLERAVDLTAQDYDVVVLDMGHAFHAKAPAIHRLEFRRADLPLLTIGGAPWDFAFFLQWLENRPYSRKIQDVLVHLIDDDGFKRMQQALSKEQQKLMGIRLHQVPYQPLQWSSKEKKGVYADLLKTILPDGGKRLIRS
ncbi:hypothetical protein [Paenibacillus mesotrionivorans]|uniref:Uncharacterized protein n=1 Tax=Paenibacillus mesotrionivorans TaxID=3160968 RepID=A0ACC7NX26_9BACL